MLGGVLTIGEQAGRLDHDVRAELAPRERGGSFSEMKRISSPSTRKPVLVASTSPGNGP